MRNKSISYVHIKINAFRTVGVQKCKKVACIFISYLLQVSSNQLGNMTVGGKDLYFVISFSPTSCSLFPTSMEEPACCSEGKVDALTLGDKFQSKLTVQTLISSQWLGAVCYRFQLSSITAKKKKKKERIANNCKFLGNALGGSTCSHPAVR